MFGYAFLSRLLEFESLFVIYYQNLYCFWYTKSKSSFTIYVIYILDSYVREYNSNMCFFLIWLGRVVDHPQPSGTFMICLWLVPIFHNIYIARSPYPAPTPRLPPPKTGGWKNGVEGGGSMIQGQVFLKGGGWHFSYLVFSLLHLEITLSFAKCAMYLKKSYFFMLP